MQVDFPFHLVAVAYRYGARRRTSNCYLAWASVLILRFMGEPVENAKFDASTLFFFAMKKDKLLQLCKYYKGEERCPETYTTNAARKLWRAEYMICNNLSDMVKATQLRESFIGAVCAYVEKWDPYFHHEVIDLYLEQRKQS